MALLLITYKLIRNKLADKGDRTLILALWMLGFYHINYISLASNNSHLFFCLLITFIIFFLF